MPRKGTSYLFKIGFPTPPPEHRPREANKTSFKGNCEYREPPPEGLPLPPPPQNADVPSNEYYQIGISALDGHIASFEERIDQVIGNQDMSSSSVKRKARKLGREQNFFKSVKEQLVGFATHENVHEEHGVEQHVVEGVLGPGVEPALEQENKGGP